ncbi:hypothetical protein ACS0TY_010155 [Phlomoides rotata]
MDFKKIAFADQLLSSPRRKVVSQRGLGVVLFFIVLSALLLSISTKGPFLGPVFQGLYIFGSYSNSSDSVMGDTSFNNSGVANETLVSNFKGGNLSVDSDGKSKIFESARVGNESVKFKDERNVSQSVGNVTLVDDSGKLGEVPVGGFNSSCGAKLGSLEEGLVGNCSGSNQENGGLRNAGINERSYKNCDIFNGRWVRDDTKPYYPSGSCPYIDRDFDCKLNGRPDSEFVKWRWQPYDCDIPRFNATDFLERLRGQKLVFVGDSLNRNMWESLVCVLRHGVVDKTRVYEISGRHEFKKKGFYAFRFEDYNCTVDFVSSPFLVKELSHNGKNGSYETLRLDLMDGASMYHDADIIIFNTGHWWTHEKTSRGEDYYQEGNYVHPRLKVLEAYKRALATWARWVDKNIDRSKTAVVFRGYSVTHFRGGPWNSGGQCNNEREPIFNETHLAKYPAKMRVLEHVLQDIKTPVTYLNISRLTDYRKDGHPSIYRPDYQASQQEIHAQDCSHWCLPGVPDTWNELLYVSLLKSGLQSWRD